MSGSGDAHQLSEEVSARLAGVNRKFIVLSGKGGVGKTAFAVNLAVTLADSGRKVCLLDTDLHGPNVPRFLGVTEHLPGISDGLILPVRFSENLGVVSPAFMHGTGDVAVIWRGPLKAAAIRKLILGVRWGSLDFLVVDSPPGTGDEPLSAAQLLPAPAAAVLVTTPQEVALDDMRRAAAFCRRVGLPVAGMVENMSGMTCPHCGGRIDLYKKGAVMPAALALGIPFLGEIAFDPAMVVASDKGVPFVRACPDAPAAASIRKISASLAAWEPDRNS